MADEKKKRPNEQKDSNKYTSGDANKNTVADLNAINFANRTIKKLQDAEKNKNKNKNTNTTNTNKKKSNTTSAGSLAFGGTVLGKRRQRRKRIKKNNRLV